MKLSAIDLYFLLIASILCIALQADASEDASLPVRTNVVLPKIFNFELFKQLYNKSYGSVIENLARRRIYLAKSFRAFISMVFYKHRQSSSYLAINDMSDWTPEEIDKTFMDPNVAFKGIGLPHVIKKEKSSEEVPVADLEDIKEELEEIVEYQSDESNFKLIANELDETTSGTYNPLKEPKPVNANDLNDFVPSNNPNYREPEILGDAIEREVELNTEKSIVIVSESDSNFLNQMIQKIFTFGGSEKDNKVDKNRMYIDHRACFQEPRRQYNCGSCYAFSTIALYEWNHCMKTGESVAFSEQYIVDCGKRVGLVGCKGGVTDDVHTFVEKYGLELNRNYPYKAKEGTCPYAEEEPDTESMGYLRVHSDGFNMVESKNLEKELKKSPLLVLLNTNIDFSEYGGGVDEPKTCKEIYHGMVLVGSGQEDGRDYWLIRNSHGVNWGERGYYKLTKKSTCSETEFYYRLDNYKVIKVKSEV